ncbi:alpha/beta hydrolase [Sphingosinicella terrae]|uniref:alpha/beta hydrolase n=1 Tax=Sphingosinicella terrae TaxID=2172047 RepID=UPI000E0DAB85|nr:hypothetical protein [Sphingosinicella terrae]
MARGRRRPLIFSVLILLSLVVAAYAAVVASMWHQQERLLFPSYMVAPAGPLPPGAERLGLDTADGVRLEGLHIPARAGRSSDTLLLVFAGNGSNAQGVAEIVHQLQPDHDVAAFFYRGYAPSGGIAAAQALTEDAPLVHDLLVRRYRPGRIVAVGVSLGSGVAAALAARRPLAGAILVTPFDSLAATGGQLYPWLPVSLLFRHDINSAELLRGSSVPVAIIAAGDDRLVRPERTDALRDAVGRLVFDATLPGARHNDILVHPDFESAMKEALTHMRIQRDNSLT